MKEKIDKLNSISTNKKILLKLLRYSGLPLVFRYGIQRSSLTVIYYHKIDPISFEWHLKYFVRNYNIISLNLLSDFLYGRIESLPTRSLLITFDDGHSSNLLLYDLIKKYQVRPTVFLSTGLMGTNKPFWFGLPFRSSHEKRYLKSVSDKERLDYLQRNYAEELNTPVNQALAWDEVLKMSEFVDFQSHTINHPCLPKCSDEVAYTEIKDSKETIERVTKIEVQAIAYPNGDYSEREISLCKKTGYFLAFTGKPGFISQKSDPFALTRFSMNDTNDLDDFIIRVTGIWGLLKRFVNYFK